MTHGCETFATVGTINYIPSKSCDGNDSIEGLIGKTRLSAFSHLAVERSVREILTDWFGEFLISLVEIVKFFIKKIYFKTIYMYIFFFFFNELDYVCFSLLKSNVYFLDSRKLIKTQIIQEANFCNTQSFLFYYNWCNELS